MEQQEYQKTRDPKEIASDMILEYIGNGQKINAIKLYRETYGLGLRESKEKVDEIIRSMQRTITMDTLEDIDPEITQLCKENRKIAAIKLTRDIYGLGLRESKDIIDRLFILMAPKELFNNMDEMRRYIHDNSTRFNEDWLIDMVEQAHDLGYDGGENVSYKTYIERDRDLDDEDEDDDCEYTEEDIENAREDGSETGYQEGYDRGKSENQEESYNNGFSDGQQEGYEEGGV